MCFLLSVCKTTATSFSLPVCTLHEGSHGGLGLLAIGVSAGSVTVSSGKPEGSGRFLVLIRVTNLALADAAGVPGGTRSGIGETISGLIISCMGVVWDLLLVRNVDLPNH